MSGTMSRREKMIEAARLRDEGAQAAGGAQDEPSEVTPYDPKLHDIDGQEVDAPAEEHPEQTAGHDENGGPESMAQEEAYEEEPIENEEDEETEPAVTQPNGRAQTMRRRRMAALAAAVVAVVGAGGYWAFRPNSDTSTVVQDDAARAAAKARVAAARAAAIPANKEEREPAADEIGRVPTGTADAGRPVKPVQTTDNTTAGQPGSPPSTATLPGAVAPGATANAKAPTALATAPTGPVAPAARPVIATAPSLPSPPAVLPPPPPAMVALPPPPPLYTPPTRPNPMALSTGNADELERALGGGTTGQITSDAGTDIERSMAGISRAARVPLTPVAPQEAVVADARLDTASRYGGRITRSGRTEDFKMGTTIPGLGVARSLRPWGDSWELVTDAGVVRPRVP